MARSPFGERFRHLRREMDLTLVDVAKVLDASVSYVSAVERGVRNPFDEGSLRKILKKFERLDALDELIALANRSRRAVEIPIASSKSEVADMALALERRAKDGTLSEKTAKEIMQILNREQD
jgi:transcriptional regulator with XRE-family HTH domain